MSGQGFGTKLRTGLSTHIRIIGAIALKDVGDAIRNRTTLSVMLGAAVMMVSSLALPLLTRLNAKPTAVVVDPGRSALIRALTTREEFRLGIVANHQEMEEAVGNASELRLGLVIPADLNDGSLASGSEEVLTLPGYVQHWGNADEVTELVTFFEVELTQSLLREVKIEVEGNAVYPVAESFGQHTMTASAMSLAVVTLGLVLVPGLLVEEKETHTLEAVLVSPARYGHVITSKALAGIFYGLSAAIIVYLFAAKWFVHGWLLVSGLGLGILFSVAVGLLLGLLIDNPSSIQIWTSLALLVLLVPAILGSLISDAASGTARSVIAWMPTAALGELLTLSMARTVSIADWGRPVVSLGVSLLITSALAVWRVRHLERRR